MTLDNLQESGLEVGTAKQETRQSPQDGLIEYILSSCVDLVLAAMDSETRQTFRAVSSSCRQSVLAYSTSLSLKPSNVSSCKGTTFRCPSPDS